MNKFPAWLNTLVLVILMTGILLALPNVYGSSPALQVAAPDDGEVTQALLEEFVGVVEEAGHTPDAAWLKDGRAVLRFAEGTEVASIRQQLLAAYTDEYSVAMTLASRMPAWLRGLGLNPMSLGLDLRGGVYVLLEVDMDTAITTRMERYVEDFDDRLREAGIRVDNRIVRHRVDLDNNIITVRFNSPEATESVREVVRAADEDVLISAGADGRSLRIRMTDEQIRERQVLAIEQNVTTLRNRVDQLGVAEPIVQQQGVDRIVVQLPGVQDPNELRDILRATATIEFRLVDGTGGEMPGSQLYRGRGDEPPQYLQRRVIASGDQIINAAASQDANGAPAVSIRLDSAGGESMLEITQNNLGRPMSTVFIETTRETVVRNGVETQETIRTEEIISTATIRGVFKSNFQITGLNPAEAAQLALLLRAGALAAPVYIIDERTIGPSLGQDNIDRGFQAITIGFLAVIVFMAIYYRVFGLVANVALLSNLVFIVALLSMLQASLTLPGIAGIVLTVGMAVDANVLIFERIREEIAAGERPQSAINSGYEKALSSIADANITTLIAAIVLFAFGTGPIKGFAITLSLGIVTSMFTAIIGTRAIVNLAFGGRKNLKSLPV